MDQALRIGDLAKRTGVSTPTLRYYEEQGLLPPAQRTDSGYRVYGPQALGRLGFIQRAKSLGLTLTEIRQLVQAPEGGAAAVARVRHAVVHKLADTRRRIAELQTLQGDLEALQEQLTHGELATCGSVGDCECWLPTGKEVESMTQIVREGDTCTCCGCSCPSESACSCCGCTGQDC